MTLPTSSYSPEQISSAQALADSLGVVAQVLIFGLGILGPIAGLVRGWRLRRAYVISLSGMLAGGLILDFAIVLFVHHSWPGMLKQLAGDYGEQPVTPALIFVGMIWSALIFLVGSGVVRLYRYLFVRPQPEAS